MKDQFKIKSATDFAVTFNLILDVDLFFIFFLYKQIEATNIIIDERNEIGMGETRHSFYELKQLAQVFI